MPASGNVTVDPTTTVHASVILEGDITVGKYCRIEAGTVISGTVRIGDNTSIFLNCAIRSYPSAPVIIGDHVNVFDNVNIEGGCPRQFENGNRMEIGDGCWINHGAVMHGCKIGPGAVIGMNAALNYNCRIGAGAIVMEGSALHHSTEVPANSVVEGVPGKIIAADITDEDRLRLIGIPHRQYIEGHARENRRIAEAREARRGD